MAFSDKLSTFMGAPPNLWKESERTQMKNIQKCYKIAYSGNHDQRVEFESIGTQDEFIEVEVEEEANEEEVEETTGEKENRLRAAQMVKDEERFLPQNSPLRSKGCEMKQPANSTFKDFDTFQNSCNFDYWQRYFDTTSGDQLLVETARAMLSSICVVQSKNQLRVHKGHAPFRKRREHITPLALCLHEQKDWCVTFLRQANPDNEETFREIKNRIVYLESLARKEVWGNAAVTFGQGIRMEGHDKLFRTLSTAKNLLEKAEAYSYRRFCGKSSREKLRELNDTIKQLINRELRVLSGRFELKEKLEDAKTSTLNPALLLGQVEDMQLIDFTNPVNVLLFKLFQNEFVRACFASHFETSEVKEIIKELGNWSKGNLFCRNGAKEPMFLMEKEKNAQVMPQVYKPTANELKVRLKKVNSTTSPDPVKVVVKKLKGAWEKDEVVETIMKKLMKCLAAVQELIPSLYAVYKLYELAGEGGNFTIYDNMRDNVMRLMADVIKRVTVLQKASRSLGKTISQRCALKEKEIKKKQMRTGKSMYKPNWVNNHTYVSVQLERKSAKAYSNVFTILKDIAKTARDYTLTSDELNDKVDEAKKMLDMFVGFEGKVEERIADVDEEVVPLNVVKKDKDSYIASKSPVTAADSDDESEFMFGANNNFGDSSVAQKSKRPVMNYDSDDSY